MRKYMHLCRRISDCTGHHPCFRQHACRESHRCRHIGRSKYTDNLLRRSRSSPGRYCLKPLYRIFCDIRIARHHGQRQLRPVTCGNQDKKHSCCSAVSRSIHHADCKLIPVYAEPVYDVCTSRIRQRPDHSVRSQRQRNEEAQCIR